MPAAPIERALAECGKTWPQACLALDAGFNAVAGRLRSGKLDACAALGMLTRAAQARKLRN